MSPWRGGREAIQVQLVWAPGETKAEPTPENNREEMHRLEVESQRRTRALDLRQRCGCLDSVGSMTTKCYLPGKSKYVNVICKYVNM